MLPVVGPQEERDARISEDREVPALRGATAARIFRRGRDPVEVSPEAVLNEYTWKRSPPGDARRDSCFHAWSGVAALLDLTAECIEAVERDAFRLRGEEDRARRRSLSFPRPTADSTSGRRCFPGERAATSRPRSTGTSPTTRGAMACRRSEARSSSATPTTATRSRSSTRSRSPFAAPAPRRRSPRSISLEECPGGDDLRLRKPGARPARISLPRPDDRGPGRATRTRKPRRAFAERMSRELRIPVRRRASREAAARS